MFMVIIELVNVLNGSAYSNKGLTQLEHIWVIQAWCPVKNDLGESVEKSSNQWETDQLSIILVFPVLVHPILWYPLYYKMTCVLVVLTVDEYIYFFAKSFPWSSDLQCVQDCCDLLVWSTTLQVQQNLAGVHATLDAKEVHMSTPRHMDDTRCTEKLMTLVNARNCVKNFIGHQKSFSFWFAKHPRYEIVTIS
jgi:hypothetical protein